MKKKNVWFSEFFRVWNGREGITGLYDHDNIKGLAYALSVAKGYYKCFMCIISLNFLEQWGQYCYYPHFSDEEADAQGGNVSINRIS